MKISLTTPTLYAVDNPNTMTDSKSLSEWIKHLPIKDSLACADDLLKAVKLLNRNPGGNVKRLELMELYLSPFMDLLNQIRKLSQTRGRAERHRNENHFTRIMEELSHEIGFGFKRSILDSLAQDSAKIDKQCLAKMIYWASQSMTYDLMFAVADYRPEPPTIWREFLSLYLLARRVKVNRSPIEDPSTLEGITSSIDLSFRRAMLITILDPFNLRRGDVWNAYDYLSNFALLATITAYKTPEITTGNFLIEKSGSRKPKSLNKDNLPERARDYLLLNVNALNAVVHRHFKMLDINPDVEIEGFHHVDGNRAMHLFRTMLIHWYVSPNRRHERISEGDWLLVKCGLSDVSRYLQQVKRIADLEKTDKADQQDNENDQMIFGNKTYRWRQIDFSANGVGLIIPITEMTMLQIGQLILIENERERGIKRRHVGVVRRLVEHDDARYMKAGIQFLPGKIIPTSIPHNDNSISVLVVERNEGRNKTLITPGNVHRLGRIIEIKTGKKTAYTVKAGKLLEETCCFERFEVGTR